MTHQEPPADKPRTTLKTLLEKREQNYARQFVFELYVRVGMSLERVNEPSIARAMLSLATYRAEQTLGICSPSTQDALNLLALHDYNHGDCASALATFRRLYESTLHVWGSRDRLTRIAKVRVRQCERHLGTPPGRSAVATALRSTTS